MVTGRVCGDPFMQPPLKSHSWWGRFVSSARAQIGAGGEVGSKLKTIDRLSLVLKV